MDSSRSGSAEVSVRDQILCGDARETLDTLPAESVDAVLTSPPYYRQRDYGYSAQIGREVSVADYIEQLRRVFDSCRRLLKPQGSLWIVMGDKYVKRELMGVPWRLALTLQDDGWRLRSDCIWHKPNAMPSSTRTRPTTDHEYIFLLTKSADYYYDADAIREPHVTFTDQSKMRGGRRHFFQRDGTPEQGKNGGNANLHNGRWDQAFHPKGRNKRTVWSIPLSKYREAHFAVFPEKLAENCIRATCPPGGCVLDPFLGSGTTAVVARKLDRHYLGIDASPEYCGLARQRLERE